MEKLQSFFTKNLLSWNSKHNNRQMPWKGEKDPYKIWISEIILQQTRVEQGLAYYNRFIKKYPTVKKLAAANEADVFKLWEGLGYYSRCRNLIATAKFIANDLKGIFPDNYTDVLNLKGIGTYTAAAIVSFAYNLPYAVVDGNVNRVLARFFGIDAAIDSTAGKKIFFELANTLIDKKNAATYNQAIMDFGATVCKPKSPLCSECTLSKNCFALANDKVNILPIKNKKLAIKDRWFYYLLVCYKNEVLVKERLGKDIWQNLNEFILIEQPTQIKNLTKKAVKLVEEKIKTTNFTIQNISIEYLQQLSHQHIRGNFIEIELAAKENITGYSWMPKSHLKKLSFPKFINTFLQDKKYL
jgi:A/G-specific adenine glycosylase